MVLDQTQWADRDSEGTSRGRASQHFAGTNEEKHDNPHPGQAATVNIQIDTL